MREAAALPGAAARGGLPQVLPSESRGRCGAVWSCRSGRIVLSARMSSATVRKNSGAAGRALGGLGGLRRAGRAPVCRPQRLRAPPVDPRGRPAAARRDGDGALVRGGACAVASRLPAARSRPFAPPSEVIAPPRGSRSYARRSFLREAVSPPRDRRPSAKRSSSFESVTAGKRRPARGERRDGRSNGSNWRLLTGRPGAERSPWRRPGRQRSFIRARTALFKRLVTRCRPDPQVKAPTYSSPNEGPLVLTFDKTPRMSGYRG